MRIAAVLSVHGSAPYLAATLASIATQTRAVDLRIAVADSVTAATRDLLAGHGFSIHPATSTAQDAHTRIAHNFAQGVRAARECEIAVLGDHDDVWHAHRVAHHVASTNASASWVMHACDGQLVDGNGDPVGATLRTTFPVPPEWSQLGRTRQWAYALRHSIATGGASAVHPRRVLTPAIPAGWLHDRWWSLLAIRSGGMLLDPTIVIDYRLTDTQQVGLDTQGQHAGARWLARRVTTAGRTVRRAGHLARLLSPPSAAG